MKEKISSKILNGLVIVGIILTILALISIPLLLTAFFKTSGMKVEISNMKWILTACIYLCAVPYLIALFKFKRICKLLTSENSFSPIISKEFQILAICAFAEACIYFFEQHIFICIIWFLSICHDCITFDSCNFYINNNGFFIFDNV